jgi:hypothetical protein
VGVTVLVGEVVPVAVGVMVGVVLSNKRTESTSK